MHAHANLNDAVVKCALLSDILIAKHGLIFRVACRDIDNQEKAT